MLPVYAEKRRKRVTRICVENSAKSHKTVEKSDLPPMAIQRWVGTPRAKPDAERLLAGR